MNAKLGTEVFRNVHLMLKAQKLHKLISNKNVKHNCIINDRTLENGLERLQVKTVQKYIIK